jgi:chromosome segregation ATPase
MVTIAEKIQELKLEYNERIKQIDELIKSAYIATASITASMKQMESTFKTMQNQLEDVTRDYENLKKQISNNKWMKLFGIKI